MRTVLAALVLAGATLTPAACRPPSAPAPVLVPVPVPVSAAVSASASAPASTPPADPRDREPEPSRCNVEAAFDSAARALRGSMLGNSQTPDAWLRPRLAAFPRSEAARALAEAPARRVIAAMARSDFATLATLVDPERGVCLRASFMRSCRWMTARELRGCATSRRKESWAVDVGSEDPNDTDFTCRGAFDHVFWRPGFATTKASVAYNCFPAHASRSNCGGGYIDPDVDADLYVELHLPDPSSGDGLGWRSLWLTFQTTPRGPVLRGMMSEYWGI